MGKAAKIIHGAKVTNTDAIEVNLCRYPKKILTNNDLEFIDKGEFYSIVIKNDKASRNLKMSNFFDRMPYGLIDKRVTGIGATYLEMHAKRNSIIVLPNRALAKSKCNSLLQEKGNKGKYLPYYVGGDNEEEANRTVKERFVQEWAADEEKRNKPNIYCKLLVVSDSLTTALEVARIDPSSGEYFLMIDEMDSYQIETTFRKKLAAVIDMYFKWKPDSRAMVSATFRHEGLFVPEPDFVTVSDEYDEDENTDPGAMLHLGQEEEGEIDSVFSEDDYQQSYDHDEDRPALGKDELIDGNGEGEVAVSNEDEDEDESEREKIQQSNERPELEVPHSSMEQIQNEPWIQISYKNPLERHITVKYTNSPTGCLIRTLLGITKTEKRPTILVAYNLFEGIKAGIQQLEKDDVECKVFFSENKINTELEKYHIRLKDFNGYLRTPDSNNDKPLVVFMTCAFFVGIDILDPDVHLIMVSNSAKAHTLLSVERIGQICGRLRKGAKDQTLIYDSTELMLCARYKCKNLEHCFKGNICFQNGQDCMKENPINPHNLNPEQYEVMLIKRARTILSLTNDICDVIKKHLKDFKNKDYWEEMDIIEGALGRIAASENQDEKVALTRYDIDNKLVIHYLNLDAIVDMWKTKNIVYSDRDSLCKQLKDFFGPSITITEEPFFFSKAQMPTLEQGEKRSVQEIRIRELFANLKPLEGNAQKIRSYLMKGDVIKERPENGVDIVAYIINLFCDMLSPEDIETYLFKYLEGIAVRKENIMNFYRSLSFMLLPDNDVFKIAVLNEFAYPYQKDNDSGQCTFPLRLENNIIISSDKKSEETSEEQSEIISKKMGALISRFKYDFFREIPSEKEKADRVESLNKRKQRNLVTLFKCIFELTKSKSKPSIIGIYPESFKELDKEKDEYYLIRQPKGFIELNNTEDMITKYFFPDFEKTKGH